MPTTHTHRWTPLIIFVTLFTLIVLRNAWLSDDAFITLRTVDNLVSGYGPVWNVGERVQAYTHPLWMLLLAAAYAVTHEAYYTTLVVAMAVAVITALVLATTLAHSATNAWLGLLLITLSKAFVDYSTSGLENPLTHLCLIAFWALYFTRPVKPPTLLWLALWSGLGLLNRMDSGLLFLPALLYRTWQLRSGRALGMVALGLLPFIAWEAFALFYYGFPFPNTAYAKLNTELPRTLLIEQGLFYLLQACSTDPLTICVLITGCVLPWLRPQRILLPVALGVLLYLIYVINIGGDFMSGRFLSAPFTCALVVLMRQDLIVLPPVYVPLLFLLSVGIGVLNPSQSPLFSNATYNVAAIDAKGIADERGHYYQRYGLLPSSRLNRLVESGDLAGPTAPEMYTHCGIGLRGFSASPFTRILDFCGLADPLLARLPTRHDPDWRIGHPIRTVPIGYFATLRTGQNQLQDAQLAAYYDHLSVLTRGDLWAPGRWVEIWKFNTGQYDYLIDRDRYRYPEMVKTTLSAVRKANNQAHDETVTNSLLKQLVKFNAQGLQIDLEQTSHAPYLELDCGCDYFQLIYLRADQEVGRQTVEQQALQLGDDLFTIVATPPTAAAQGYSTLRLIPELSGERTLADVATLNFTPTDQATLAQLTPTALLRLYYFAYYRATIEPRQALLQQLKTQLTQVDDNGWQAFPLPARIALISIPDGELQTLVRNHLPQQVLLVDEQKQPWLRYLGATETLTGPEETDQGLRFRLYFEVLGKLDKEYSAWFHIVAKPNDNEYMIYDYFPDLPTSQWEPGTIYTFAPVVMVKPGEYDLAFGFWTPHFRERLYVADSDAYWISLGLHTMRKR